MRVEGRIQNLGDDETLDLGDSGRGRDSVSQWVQKLRRMVDQEGGKGMTVQDCEMMNWGWGDKGGG